MYVVAQGLAGFECMFWLLHEHLIYLIGSDVCVPMGPSLSHITTGCLLEAAGWYSIKKSHSCESLSFCELCI